MQAFFHVKLKFATIVIQEDSPLLPGMGFTKQPFSALWSHKSSRLYYHHKMRHLHKPDFGKVLCNNIKRLDLESTQQPYFVPVVLGQAFDNPNCFRRDVLTLTFELRSWIALPKGILEVDEYETPLRVTTTRK